MGHRTYLPYSLGSLTMIPIRPGDALIALIEGFGERACSAVQAPLEYVAPARVVDFGVAQQGDLPLLWGLMAPRPRREPGYPTKGT